MKIVVGLGNPGRRYEASPHNAGFAAVDRLAAVLKCRLRRSWRIDARLGRAAVNGEDVLLVKPLTYMNLSGRAVAAALGREGVEASNLIVALDDADLELGRLRVRAKGSSGGHKGLQSVIDSVGTDGFPRVRIGIGRGGDGGDLIEHVLSPLSGERRARMDRSIERAAAALLRAVESGVEDAMNEFNGRCDNENV